MKFNAKSGAALAIAAAGLVTTGVIAASTTADAASNYTVKCYGLNACKGHGSCKTVGNACKGRNACKGQGISMLSKSKCLAKGGSTSHS